VVIFDRFAPAQAAGGRAIWIEPPDGSPFRTRARLREVRAIRWHPEHDVCSGLRSRAIEMPATQVFAPGNNDVAFADVDGGPVGLLRPSVRMAAIGFHPGRGDMRYDLATPLLLANLLRWIEPDVFRAAEVHGGTVGTVTSPLDRTTDTNKVRVIADSVELPYTVQDGTLRFFSGAPGVVRVIAGDREQIHSLSLPEIGEQTWQPPASARRGVPGAFSQAVSRDVWRILAVLGALGLVAEWMLYGRRRRVTAREGPASVASAGSWRQAS
jgi:hypothetical protein